MAGERGRDGDYDPHTYPPPRGVPGWEPEAGYPGAGYPPAGDSYPADDSYPAADPYPTRDSYPATDPYQSDPYRGDPYRGDPYRADPYRDDPYSPPGAHRPRNPPPPHDPGQQWDPYRPDDGYPPAGWDGQWTATRDGYPATTGLDERYPGADDRYSGVDGRYPLAAGADRHPPAGGPGRERAESRRSQRKRRGLPLWQELPLLLIIAFCLAVLVRTFLLQAFYIPSGSMEDTLIAGDRVLVNKVVYNFRDPARGEVVVFEGTDSWAPVGTGDADIGMFAKVGRTLGDLVGISRPGEKDFIKRVVGVPGDTVSCCDVDGRVFVNGQPLDETYVIRDSPLDDGPPDGAQDCRTRRFDEVVVQPGNIFVMGDHRQVSQDSRCQGQVPIDNVIGRAFLIVWPSGRWDSLPAPDTFDGVPQPVAAGPVAVPPADHPVGPANLAFVLPLLLPVGGTFRLEPARSRLIGRATRRRLAA